LSATRSLHGFHAIASRLRLRPQSVRAVYTAAGRDDPRMRDLVARVVRRDPGPHGGRRPSGDPGTSRHQGVVDVDAAVPASGRAIEGLGAPALVLTG
jgi:hypothetical protein